jgi:hypothetical protein
MSQQSIASKSLNRTPKAPVLVDQSTLTAYSRGPVSLADDWLLDETDRFDRERISKLTAQDLPKAVDPTVLRPLGSFEEFFWLIDQNRPVHFAMAAQVQGATTIRRWRDALDLVQRRHPLLSVCIETNRSSRPHFRQEMASPIPLRVVQGDNASQRWESEMELELSIPFNAQQAPLVRAVLLHEANQVIIILVAHHSIADGRSIVFVIRDLLQALSGSPIDLLPLLPTHEEILGVTRRDAIQVEISKESNAKLSGKPAAYVSKEDSRPRIKGLRLTPGLTSRLRERARQEGTTVHGALCSALALAFWRNNPESWAEPIRICSPIDTRKLLGLGQDCAALIDAGVVTIEPDARRDPYPQHTEISVGLLRRCQMPNDFWDMARHSIAGLARTKTLEGVVASRNVLHQTVKNGIDVPTAAAICAHAFAHEIMLTNLGNLPYETDFGQLRLETIWGPSVSARFAGVPTIGVATTNGALCLVETSFTLPNSLLETTEQILLINL